MWRCYMHIFHWTFLLALLMPGDGLCTRASAVPALTNILPYKGSTGRQWVEAHFQLKCQFWFHHIYVFFFRGEGALTSIRCNFLPNLKSIRPAVSEEFGIKQTHTQTGVLMLLIILIHDVCVCVSFVFIIVIIYLFSIAWWIIKYAFSSHTYFTHCSSFIWTTLICILIKWPDLTQI